MTTGKGSGKSLCFFIPIVGAVLAAKAAGSKRRTSAIAVYPMNALANSQRERLDKFLSNVKDERWGECHISVTRYTWQEDNERRRQIAIALLDILLTNFMMLKLPMTRQGEVDPWVILVIYEAMAMAIRTGQPYATGLALPPADPRVAHPPDPTHERTLESAT